MCQKRTHAPQRTGALLDHLVGAGEQVRRHSQPERLCGGEIHHQIELGRLLDREFARPGAAQDLVDVIGGACAAGQLAL